MFPKYIITAHSYVQGKSVPCSKKCNDTKNKHTMILILKCSQSEIKESRENPRKTMINKSFIGR